MRIAMLVIILVGWLSGFGQPAGYAVFNRTFTIDGEGVTHMNEGPGDGVAWIKEQSFTEGTIEVDIRGKDVFQQSFVGMAYHGSNDSTFEAVYFRPFNFHGADPARVLHAVQYVAPPVYDWQKLRTDHPNQYEKGINPAPNANDWFHVRIEVRSDKVSVFVNGSAVASLEVAPVVHRPGEKIGYWVGNGSGGDWKNLHIITTK